MADSLDDVALIDAILAQPRSLPPLIVCYDGVARSEPPSSVLAWVGRARSTSERDRRIADVLAQYAVAGVNCPAFEPDDWPPFQLPAIVVRTAPWRTLAN
ncbi:MAG: hypothetical protein ABW167_07825 [Baekduia sp.]